ncbi:MAG TPA: hypothetical protein VFE51_29170 [Verrucomicrobiae bacterium]|nr:hypothetical protein [Verrucomicrobiae bacterium]
MSDGVVKRSFWPASERGLVFLLAATSLGCLLADFYGVCSMRVFTLAVFVPAMGVLSILVVYDFFRRDGRLARPVAIGLAAGLAAAVAYDLFRLPFVFAKAWGIASIVPPLNLFKVFPAFGAMILGEPVRQASYSSAALWLGWLYHFSNGATIGVMYLALIGDARARHWSWAVLLAMGLELGMLFTPYPRVFGIPVTTRFVLVTLSAHAVFGLGLGLGVKAMWPA